MENAPSDDLIARLTKSVNRKQELNKSLDNADVRNNLSGITVEGDALSTSAFKRQMQTRLKLNTGNDYDVDVARVVNEDGVPCFSWTATLKNNLNQE